jgi:hypothetical protein
LTGHLGGREPDEPDQPRLASSVVVIIEHGDEVHGRRTAAGEGGLCCRDAAAAGLDLASPGLVGPDLVGQRGRRGVALLEALAEVVTAAVHVAHQLVHGREAHLISALRLFIQVNLVADLENPGRKRDAEIDKAEPLCGHGE